jgi:phosphonate transport system permease protein
MRTGDVQAVYPDPARSWIGAAPIRFVATLLLVLLVYGFSLYFVDFDVSRLWSGLPRLAHWAAKAWPPDIRELGVLIERAIETLAMAVIGTTMGVVIAAPCCILAAQNIAPSRLLYTPMRWFLNALRGIDSFIFALLFVAAVGLGPSPGCSASACIRPARLPNSGRKRSRRSNPVRSKRRR